MTTETLPPPPPPPTPTLEVTLTRILSRGLASSEKPFVRERGISGKPEIVLPFKSRGRDLHEVRRVLYWLREDTLDSLPLPTREEKVSSEEIDEELPLVFSSPKKTVARKIDGVKYLHLLVPEYIRESVEVEARRTRGTISKIVRVHLLAPLPRKTALPTFRSKLARITLAVSEKHYRELKSDAEAAGMYFSDYLGRRFVASYTRRKGGAK